MKQFYFLFFLANSVFSLPNVFTPAVSGNEAGHVCVVWSEFDGSSFAILKARYAMDWEDSTILYSEGQNSFNPCVALNEMDWTLFAWRTHNGSNFQVYGAAGSFEENNPSVNSFASAPSLQPKIGIDSEGNGMAIWSEQLASSYTLASAFYSSMAGWGAPQTISDPSKFMQNPDLALFPSSGEAIAVWQGTNNNTRVIQAALFTPSPGGWTAPVSLSAPNIDSKNPKIACNDSEAVIVWQADIDSNKQVLQSSEYTDSSWSAPVIALSTSSGAPINPCLAVNSSGRVMLLAEFQQDSASSIIAVERIDGEWGAYQKISETDVQAKNPSVALNDMLKGAALWETVDGRIRASLYIDEDWQSPITISSSDAVNSNPVLWMGESGMAVAVWQATAEGTTLCQAAILEGETWGPPQTLSP